MGRKVPINAETAHGGYWPELFRFPDFPGAGEAIRNS